MVAAVDVNDRPGDVVEHAVVWARRFGMRLDLAFASEWSTEGLPPPPYPTDEILAIRREWERRAGHERQALERMLDEVPPEQRGTARVIPGRAVHVLPELSTAMVLVGTHARRGLERVLLGSVAARVLRQARSPVLVVGLGDPAHVPEGPLRVLAPVDEADVGALPWLQRHLPAVDLTIVHVQPPGGWTRDVLLGDPLPADPEARRHALLVLLRDRAAAHGFGGAPAHVAERDTGNAGDTVARLAGELRADLVVLPTHGRTGLERMVIGSVAERVAERAPCPVLVIPRAANT